MFGAARPHPNQALLPAFAANGLNCHQYGDVAGSWHSHSLRDIASYEHLPIVKEPLPTIQDSHQQLQGELAGFKYTCTELFTEKNGSFSLSRKELDELFTPLRSAAQALHSAQVTDCSHLIAAIDEAKRFLSSRGGWAQNQWFNEVTAKVINEGYLLLHVSHGSLSPEALEQHRAHVDYPSYMRTYEIARRDGLVSALEAAVKEQLPDQKIKALFQEVAQLWQHNKNRCTCGVGLDLKFKDLFDLARNTFAGKWPGQGSRSISVRDAAALITQVLRAEFDFERWNTPNAVWGTPEAEAKLVESLESRTPSSLWLQRLRDQEHQIWLSFPWMVPLTLSSSSPAHQLQKVANELTTRNRGLMPHGDLLHYSHLDTNTAPYGNILNEFVAIQRERQAKPAGDEAVTGMLRIYEGSELADSLKRGAEACFLKVGSRLLNFYLVAPHLRQASALGLETADSTLATPLEQQYYFDLVVQRNEANQVTDKQYQVAGAYPFLDNLVKAALRVHHVGHHLHGSAVSRLAPNPNTSIKAHQRVGWKADGEEIDKAPFTFGILRRTTPGASPLTLPPRPGSGKSE